MNVWMYYRDFSLVDGAPRGGMDKSVHGLSKALAAKGVRVTVLSQNPAASAARTPYELRILPRRRTMAAIGAMLEEGDRPDVALLHGIFTPGVYFVARILARHSVPYGACPHDPYNAAIFARRRMAKAVYWQACERRMLRGARFVSVLDRRHGRFIAQRGVATPVVEIPDGILDDEVLPEQPLQPSSRPARLLFLGRLDSHNKGLDLLVKAFRSLPPGTGALLTIQGPDGGDRDRLLVAAEGEPAITFEPADYALRSSQVCGAHDILCLPSRFEGFGLSALEAMAAARPVLVSSVSGISPHVAKADCGVVVNPDEDSIRSGILRLMEMRSEWPAMGARGRAYVLSTLTWDRVAARALPELEELVARGRILE